MATDQAARRRELDSFQSMVGVTGPYPDDPQHPDPGFDVNPTQDTQTPPNAHTDDMQRQRPYEKTESATNDIDDRTVGEKAKDFVEGLTNKVDGVGEAVGRTFIPSDAEPHNPHGLHTNDSAYDYDVEPPIPSVYREPVIGRRDDYLRRGKDAQNGMAGAQDHTTPGDGPIEDCDLECQMEHSYDV